MASVEKLPTGRWRIVVSLGRNPITGKYGKAQKVIDATGKRDAQQQANAYELELQGKRVDGANTTLRTLLDTYLEQRTKMSANTRRENEDLIARSIPKPLGDLAIRKVGAYELDQLYRHLEARGGMCRRRGDNRCPPGKPCEHGGGDPLSSATVDRLHTIIHAAFRVAVRWEWLATNPATHAEPSAVVRNEVQLPPARDLAELLIHLDGLERDVPGPYRATTGTPLTDFVAVLLGSAARSGELCAVRFGAIDGSVLTVRESVARARGGATVKDTKTHKVRHLTLPASVLAVIEARRTMWAPVALASGMPIDDCFVFPSRSRPDRPWRPDTISRELRQVRDALGLSPLITFRNLRHDVQSVLLAKGVDVNTTAKRGGHSAGVLLGVYAHLMAAPDAAAAVVLEEHWAEVRTLPSKAKG